LTILLNNAALRATMSLHAATYALDYAWEKIAVQIVEVYKELATEEINEADKPIP
ncbi:MAG: hypothetical protein IT311_01025, partial [Anaerolineales bacterium]|nr:hypothetical protein [Anaerolineales bacterium]